MHNYNNIRIIYYIEFEIVNHF